ncbi:MAG: hypothetical protein HZB25_04410 [Candidatus Eisenbacteria bacterium]|nr:hypothetical protein [Candidatus Eisenbacteria bacterium]
MRRPLAMLILAVLALTTLAFDVAEARRVVVRRGGPRHRRTVVVVHKGFPLRRTLPQVVVRAPRAVWKIATPAVFLAPVVWAGTVVALPEPGMLVWEDKESLDQEDDWTEFSLNADSRGTALFLQVEGRVQAEFAEVVFGNGESQVVDFESRTWKPGIYQLLDFKDGRTVDHVRMVARAKSEDAVVILRLQK